ncbi:MAG: hypothetical protein IT228_05550 [Flavobacteriales bacterium]|nr:hypothetical protein [Flavobacteriales bacterium]MCC6576790.1 hypothetical protein [Flavobacteriales bacterium]
MLHVLLEHPSPRARWVVEHTLGRMLGLSLQITADADTFARAEGPKLSYGTVPVQGAVHVPWSGALTDLPAHDPPQAKVDGMPVLFPHGGSFDLFAATFFLLALVDEQRCPARDPHGRIPSAALFTVRSALADKPWVDHWVLALGDRLRQRWPALSFNRTYRHLVTVDMDNLLRYAGRPVGRALGATLKDLVQLRAGAVLERWAVRWGLRPDPFLRAVDLAQRCTAGSAAPVLFLLLRGDGPHDHAVVPDRWTDELRTRLRGTADLRPGLHPSYATRDDAARMAAEVALFKQHLEPRVLVSRQHFLRWHLPDTLRSLAAAGFAEEHSLGFVDRSGFRAATCTPFPWYDLEHERATDLVLWPFAAMDSALIAQHGGKVHAVTAAMCAASDHVRAVGGTFVSVWHDRYLSGHREFAPWPAVLERVVKHAKA